MDLFVFFKKAPKHRYDFQRAAAEWMVTSPAECGCDPETGCAPCINCAMDDLARDWLRINGEPIPERKPVVNEISFK